MKHSIITALLSLPLVVGCSAPSSDADDGTDTSEAAYASSGWEKALTCNGGAAVLDVRSAERRQLQFVIRDSDAINYLTGAIHQQMLLNRGNGRELIASGWSKNGVFHPGDFGSFTQDATDYSSRILVSREGKGIKITFSLHTQQNGECTQWCSDEPTGASYCCGGYAGGSDAYPELANWYFDDCR